MAFAFGFLCGLVVAGVFLLALVILSPEESAQERGARERAAERRVEATRVARDGLLRSFEVESNADAQRRIWGDRADEAWRKGTAPDSWPASD